MVGGASLNGWDVFVARLKQFGSRALSANKQEERVVIVWDIKLRTEVVACFSAWAEMCETFLILGHVVGNSEKNRLRNLQGGFPAQI